MTALAVIPATPIKTFADYQKYNFFRPPDWRWDRVMKLVDRKDKAGRCTRRDDDYVRAARNFLLRWRKEDITEQERDRLLFEMPGMYFAYDFHRRLNDDHEASMYLQARLLAGQTPEQIGEAMGVMPEAVTWYAAIFFDVADKLKNRDWVTKQIIAPALARGNAPPKMVADDDEEEDLPPTPFKDSTVAKPFLDGSLKLFAYFGGPHLVDLMIGGMESGKPLTSPDDLKNWMDGTWSTILRRRSMQAAMSFEVNKYNVLELFAVHTRIIEIERSEESNEQARTTTERHIKAMVDEIPWAVGDDGVKLYGGTTVGRFDSMAGELRDDELLRIASGQTAPTLSDYPDKLPPPRRDKKSVVMAQTDEI